MLQEIITKEFWATILNKLLLWIIIQGPSIILIIILLIVSLKLLKVLIRRIKKILIYQATKNENINTLEAGLYYNVQGKTLEIVGIKDRPDIYVNPFHSLNLNISKQFKSGIGIGIKVKNILSSKDEKVYQSYNAQDQYYEFKEEGVSYGFSISYKF